MTQENNVFSEVAQREIAAYEAFRLIYESKNPPPVEAAVVQDDRLSKVGLLVIMFAALVVSASHTIPVFVGTLPEIVQQSSIVWVVAVMVFVMIEASLVFYSFIRTKNHAVLNQGARPEYVHKLMNGGMWLAFAIAVAGNIYSAFEVKLDTLPAWWVGFDASIAFLTGLSAPVLAFISGDILGMLTVVDNSRVKRARSEYAVQMGEWQEGLNASWNSNKKKWGVGSTRIQVEQAVHSVHSLRSVNDSVNEQATSVHSDERSVNAPVNAPVNGYSKNMNAKDIARAFFEAHPGVVFDESVSTTQARELVVEWSGRNVAGQAFTMHEKKCRTSKATCKPLHL
jgi:hypothetical protein